MSDEINIRKGKPDDWAALADVFHRAVQEGAHAYTTEQRRAWSPQSKAGPDWSLRLSRQSVMLAETEADGPIGFLTLEMNGYLDCAYILPGFQGRGLFRRLYIPLETGARAAGETRIYTHASLHAQPAFSAMGFQIVKPETVGVDGVWLPRFLMEKQL